MDKYIIYYKIDKDAAAVQTDFFETETEDDAKEKCKIFLKEKQNRFPGTKIENLFKQIKL